jgi:uncharacterized protein
MLFAFIGFDKKDGAPLRSAKVSEHVAYLHAGGMVKFAGPFTDDAGKMIGSFIIVDVLDRKAAEDWVANEPFARAGLFERSELHSWFQVINTLKKG